MSRFEQLHEEKHWLGHRQVDVTKESLAMTKATLRTTPSKENIYFYICSLRLLVSELANVKYVMSSFNSK